MFLLTGVFWGRIVRVLLTCVETSQSPGFEVGPVTPYFGFQHGDWLILKNTDRTIQSNPTCSLEPPGGRYEEARTGFRPGSSRKRRAPCVNSQAPSSHLNATGKEK